jgi:DNA-binding beta-propeller fold protein YncE
MPNHPFIGAVISGTEGSPPQAKLEAPCGVGVGPEGELYVSDYRRRSILGVSLPAYFPDNGACGLAADPFNVYANYWHGGVVNTATGVISSAPATGVAVDPVSFDLYVDNRTAIAVYEAPVDPGDEPAFEIDPGPEGALGDGYGIAVSAFPATAGRIYVADAADNTVKVYDPAGVDPDVPVQVIDGAGTAAGRFVSLTDASLAIDQSNGHLFVVDNTQPGFEHPQAAVSEFNAEGVYRGQLEHAIVHGEPTGIAVDESQTSSKGRVYVTSGNGSSIVIPPLGGPPASELGALYAFGPAGAGQSLEVTTSGAGQGTVKSSPSGISCPGACTAELNSGRVVTLTATPASGSVFAGWSGACSGGGDCQVTLDAATTANAEFAPAPAAPGASPDSGAAAPRADTGEGGARERAIAPTLLKLGWANPQADGTVTLRALAPASGTLIATATGLRRASVHISQAGSITLRLRLSSAGARALARAKSGRLAMRVAVAFRPSFGTAGSVVSKTVTFKRIGREKR